jgi:hypothetical protein
LRRKFRPAWAVVRHDDPRAEDLLAHPTPDDLAEYWRCKITVKAVYSSYEEAVQECERLNGIARGNSIYFPAYTRIVENYFRMESMMIDMSKLTRIEDVVDDDAEELALLQKDFEEAVLFLSTTRWCRSVEETYFGGGVSEVFVVLLHRYILEESGEEDMVWTITGDIPPAILSTEDLATPRAAMDEYLVAMHAWVDAVKASEPTEGLITVNVPETDEWAYALQDRLEMLRDEIIPHVFDEDEP